MNRIPPGVVRIAATLVICAVCMSVYLLPARPVGDDLSPAHVHAIFSARGANPGAVFQADGHRYVLRSLSVAGGGRRGAFVVSIQVDALAN